MNFECQTERWGGPSSVLNYQCAVEGSCTVSESFTGIIEPVMSDLKQGSEKVMCEIQISAAQVSAPGCKLIHRITQTRWYELIWF